MLVLDALASLATLVVLFGSLHAGTPSQSTGSSTTDNPDSAAEVPSQPALAGRLVFRRVDKTLVPITDAVVLMGVGDLSCLEPYQSRMEVRFRSDGSFSFAVDESRSFTHRVNLGPDGTAGEPYRTEDVSYGCYRFKAKRCEDMVIRYDPRKTPEHLLVMTCPGRRLPRP